MNKNGRRPSLALVLASLALLVATAPPAAAVVQRLAAGSVGTRELQDAAVTGPKMHADAVTGRTVADGSLTGDDLAARHDRARSAPASRASPTSTATTSRSSRCPCRQGPG